MKKLHLLIATDSFLPRRDGVTRFLEETIPRLEQTFNITIIGPQFRDGEVELSKNITYVSVPLSKQVAGDFPLPKFRLWKVMRTVKKADIIFSHSIGPIGGLALFFGQRFRKKTVSFIHSVDWELWSGTFNNRLVKKYAYPFGKWLSRRLYGRASHLLLPSERIADLLSWSKITTPKTIIHLGVDTNKFTPEIENRTTKRDELGLSELDLVIGYHGRISREKDLRTLVRAFIKLRRRYNYLKLLIIGSGVKQLEKQLGKQPGVVHVPAVNDVETYLPLMDIYCLPSLTETTSLSTLEAMSTSLPVITTPVGFIRDYVVHEQNGLFFTPGDSYSLTLQLERLINNKELRKKLGEQARHTVVHRFDWDVTALRLLSFFKEFASIRIKEIDKANEDKKKCLAKKEAKEKKNNEKINEKIKKRVNKKIQRQRNK
ncbi:glycosyltransferase family 4 protein [Candidatus Woesearchaeota archaeon]|nr:glycosyltransferase family 4 protein [Candidatus Woesearchaeota archaeon]